MFKNTEEHDHTFWISYTDLVTGFMIIFLIIAFIMIAKNPVSEVSPPETQVKTDTIGKGERIRGKYYELVETFRLNFKDKENIQVSDDGTIRFSVGGKKSEMLFPDNDYHMTDDFKHLLDEFIEIYYGEVKQLYEKREDSIEIKEIRIEGHTSSTGNYAHNLKLSTLRAYDVVSYVHNSKYYNRLDQDLQQFIRENTIAVGYSFTRLLDENGERVSKTNKPEDEDKSRRVEFRLILEEKTKKS